MVEERIMALQICMERAHIQLLITEKEVPGVQNHQVSKARYEARCLDRVHQLNLAVTLPAQVIQKHLVVLPDIAVHLLDREVEVLVNSITQ